MNALAQIALRSLWHFRRINLALALGVAAATAVLTGALIVGDSMRGSLKQLAIERLGDIDDLILSDSFFSAKLSSQLQALPDFQKNYRAAEPAIFFPGGSVELQQEPPRRAGQVAVLGINSRFWDFAKPKWKPHRELENDSVIINQALADHLGLTQADVSDGKARLTVRIPKQHQLPADSPMSKQDDLIESLVDLEVVEIVPNSGLGGFGLFPSQSDPLNAYLSLERLQESLEQTVLKHKSDPQQANLVLLAGKQGAPAPGAIEDLLLKAQPDLEDFGLSLKRISRTHGLSDSNQETVFDYASLTTDRLVFNDRAADVILRHWPSAKPVFTYLANDIRIAESDKTSPGRTPKSGVPFSMVTAIDFGDSFRPQSRETSQTIAPLAADEVVLVDWAAQDLGAKVGDMLELSYFEPETTHGDQIERKIKLKLVDIAKLTKPDSGFELSRRGEIRPAKFSQRPEVTNDPDLTPEVPGITDAESIERWDLPFETASKIRPQDDQYWNDHRTTPKAFVSLALGQRLWGSRFGKITSFRLPAAYEAKKSELVSKAAQSAKQFGLESLTIKRRSLDASAGSTPFDVLFLALSMFVIGSALILVALLFRLNVQHRASEVGILSAIGWENTSIRWLWLAEMSLIALVGAALGVLLGIGYAWLMIWGLTTWWVDAISSPFLKLHLQPLPILIGWISGWLVSIFAIAWSLRRALKQNTLSLLSGQLESSIPVRSTGTRAIDSLLIAVIGCGAAGLALTGIATKLSGEAQAGAFLGAGFCILIAGLLATYRAFRGNLRARKFATDASAQFESLNLFKLAKMNSRRNPLRSTLTVGLVAIASFLIAAVSAFRLAPTAQGTGGFDWVAKSSQPVLLDLSSAEGRAKLLGTDSQVRSQMAVLPLRYQAGEDASCNNLYQSTQPQILGLPQSFLNSNSSDSSTKNPTFAWASSLASSEAEKLNPWLLLRSDSPHAGTAADPIPAVLDKNTANYSLKIFALETIFKVEYERGETIHFRVVGFLANTILQGSLLIGEKDFLSAFPSVGGYQFFLIRTDNQNQPVDLKDSPTSNPASKPEELVLLEDRLSDYGFEARSADQMLANFLKVQNTYLNTFQTLGSLGLLLGTFGLAVVQLRSIFERRREFGLMRAVGFSEPQLRRLVMWENFLLLGLGLGIGIGAALFTTIPHRWLGNATIPWLELGAMFGAIALVGLLASSLASSKLNRLPLLESLRN